MNFIELENIAKIFRKGWTSNPVLENINLSIKPGEFVILKGENGSGKTTLLNLILGLNKPSRGTIKLMGLSPQDDRSKQQVSYVLQNTEMPSKIKVKELLSLWQSYYSHPLSIDEVLKKVNLDDQAESWATDLSGGQKQRLYFALALIGCPKLLVLDEPTRNLDEDGYQAFWQQIENCRQAGITILMVTNNKADQESLDKLATRTIILIKHSKLSNGNQLIENTNSQEIKTIPQPSFPQLSSSSPPSLISVFHKQVWFEGLQLIRTPSFFIGILLYAILIPIGLKLLGSKLLGSSLLPANPTSFLVVCCGGILFMIILDLARTLSVERAERWLNLLKATSLPAYLYISSKLAIYILFCSGFLLICFGVALWQLTLTGDAIYWVSVFSTLIMGIIPFALLALAFGYLLEPKSASNILGLSLIVIPFLSGFWMIPGWSLMPDLVALSPFYHYRSLVAQVAHYPNDGQVWIHILWLLWATGIFASLAIWSYQREDAMQR